VPAPRPDSQVSRVLVVAAHPDDADFGAAGTLALWAKAGIAVTLLCLTHGEQGGRPDVDPSSLPALREEEQRAAGAELGVTDVRFLDGWRDGWLEPTHGLQREVVRVIREVRPERVVCQSPERWYARLQASHPDHLAAGEVTLRAVYPAAENPFAFPELGLPFHHVGEVWLFAHPTPDHAVDVTDTFDLKVAALRAHASQTGHRDDLERWLAERAALAARRFDLPEGRLAETFAVLPLN
jgi:LmbE family N-acetylglucosaminyl deacetylase